MQSITLQAHVDHDGMLRLHVPVDMADTDVEVVVVIQRTKDPQTRTGQHDDWTQFIERTAGSLPNFPDVDRAAFDRAEDEEVVQALNEINKRTRL